MKHITKDIILNIAWILCFSLLAYVQIERLKESWEKSLFAALSMITVLLFIKNVSRIKYYTLIDDVLIIRQIFSKPKQYSLKTVSSWSENQYELLGFKTGRDIVLKTKEGEKINLGKRNSKDFEKLSDYLNENFPEVFEKN